MEDKKYQVFISSTFNDLEKERNKVTETVLSLYHFPVGMEMFSADDSEQWEIIRETINASDYYVIIIGHRYGSLAPEGISYTEKEYNYALEKGLPILAFIKDRHAPTSPNERESEPELIQKLNVFVEKAMANKMCDTWSNIDELATKIAIALPKVFRRKPRVGWVRGTEAISKEISQELANLSNENRGLREKIDEFEKLSNIESPDILIDFNNKREIELNIPTVISGLIEQPHLYVESIPIHLKNYISEDDIENYNEKIPFQEAIDSFNLDYRKYILAKNNKSNLVFNISNEGSVKANDIHIIIDFPDNVIVIDKRELDKIHEPDSPLPTSIIEIAEKQYLKDKKSKQLKSLGLSTFALDPLGIANLSNHSVISNHFMHPEVLNMKRHNPNRWTSIKGNRLFIRVKSLMHKRSIDFDDEIILVPLKISSEIATVNIICEEYKSDLTFDLSVVIKEEQN